MPSARTAAGSSPCLETRSTTSAGSVGAGQLGHPPDLGEVRDRHDPGDDRDVHAERGDPVDEPEVVLGPEEQLGDREVRAGPGLLGEHPGVAVERLRRGVPLGERRHPDAEVAERLDQLDQLHGVAQALGVRRCTAPRAPPTGRRAARARCGPRRRRSEPITERSVVPGVADAGQVRQRGHRGVLRDPLGDPRRCGRGWSRPRRRSPRRTSAAAPRARAAPSTAAARPARPSAGRTRTRTTARRRRSGPGPSRRRRACAKEVPEPCLKDRWDGPPLRPVSKVGSPGALPRHLRPRLGRSRLPRRGPEHARHVRRRAGRRPRPARRRRGPAGRRRPRLGLRRQAVPRGVLLLGLPRGPRRRVRRGAPAPRGRGALELLHASALVHDDYMDASDIRRGRPATHRAFEALPPRARLGRRPRSSTARPPRSCSATCCCPGPTSCCAPAASTTTGSVTRSATSTRPAPR